MEHHAVEEREELQPFIETYFLQLVRCDLNQLFVNPCTPQWSRRISCSTASKAF